MDGLVSHDRHIQMTMSPKPCERNVSADCSDKVYSKTSWEFIARLYKGPNGSETTAKVLGSCRFSLPWHAHFAPSNFSMSLPCVTHNQKIPGTILNSILCSPDLCLSSLTLHNLAGDIWGESCLAPSLDANRSENLEMIDCSLCMACIATASHTQCVIVSKVHSDINSQWMHVLPHPDFLLTDITAKDSCQNLHTSCPIQVHGQFAAVFCSRANTEIQQFLFKFMF